MLAFRLFQVAQLQGGYASEKRQETRQTIRRRRYQKRYKSKIHWAVTDRGQYDPYTGEAPAWELIATWDTSHQQPDGYKKQFALMPTVDHITPDELEFEICSWQINDCKNDLTPEEFMGLCSNVAAYRSRQSTVQ